MAILQIAQHQEEQDLSSRHIRRLHKKALEQIQKAMAPFGYYSVKVDSVLEKDGQGGWKALYKVESGARVKVATFTILAEGAGKDDPFFTDLADTFPLQPGDAFLDSSYESGKKKILLQAMAHGYIKVKFSRHTVKVHPAKGTVNIELTLSTGPLFHFGATSTEQEIITSDLFQHFIPWKEGDVFSLKLLNQLRADLFATGYFSQVLVEPKIKEQTNELIPVQVNAKEVKRNRYSLGVGYGTDTGLRGHAGWHNSIFNQHGHKPSLNVQLSEEMQRFSGNYEIPIFDPRFDNLSFDGLYRDETWDDTWSKKTSISATVNHNEPKLQYGAGIELLYEDYTVGQTSGTAKLLMPKGYWTLILAENRLNTVNGLRLDAEAKGANTALLASTSFLQFRVGGKLILTPMEKWRILGRISLGATEMDSIDELPPSLRFYAGGDQSVRGYSYKSLGPTDPSGVVIGGQYLFESSIELERQVYSVWSLAAFYDAGNAFDDIDADLKQGAGLGVRMTLPFGQVRVDVAVPLFEDGYPLHLHLSIGADL